MLVAISGRWKNQDFERSFFPLFYLLSLFRGKIGGKFMRSRLTSVLTWKIIGQLNHSNNIHSFSISSWCFACLYSTSPRSTKRCAYGRMDCSKVRIFVPIVHRLENCDESLIARTSGLLDLSTLRKKGLSSHNFFTFFMQESEVYAWNKASVSRLRNKPA